MNEVKRRIAQHDNGNGSQLNLITLQCMICFVQFNDSGHKPILICTNQHNMCKTCVDKKLFKIQKKQDNETYLCPLCNQQVQQKNLRQNNLLLQVYKWISQISQRQKQRILLIKSDMDDLKSQSEATKCVVQKLYEENTNLHQILDSLHQQNKLQIQVQVDAKKNDNKYLKHVRQNLILKYEAIIKKLKSQNSNIVEQVQKQEKQYVFGVDKTHEHFVKFKINKNGSITMQGPFYRSFFQDFNYFYNIVSQNPIILNKYMKDRKIKFQIEIISTKKGRIFVGFINQRGTQQVDSHLKKDFFGFNIQTGDFQICGQTKKTKLHGYKAQSVSIYQFQLQYAYKQPNFQVYFTVKLKQKSPNPDKTQKIMIQLKDLQLETLYPIVSMQMVDDSIKIISI